MELCVATDLSPAAAGAARLAFDWAKRLGARVRLVHVVHDPDLAPALTSDVPGDVVRARAELAAMAASSGVPCETEVRTGEDIVACILAAAGAADMLLVASQGKSFLQRLRLGSTAANLLRQSRIPVVCLPAAV